MFKVKKTFILILCFSCVLLAGCNSSDDLITKFYMEKLDTSGKYNEYMKLKEENKLDKNGEYIGDQSQTDEEAEEAIPVMASVAEDRPFHVAFAENRAFNIEYYKDEKYTEILFANQEYNEDENSEESENQTDKFIYEAKPGEKIYAKITKKDNAIDLYELSSFRIKNKDGDSVLSDINVEKSDNIDNKGTQYAEIEFDPNINNGEECDMVVEPLGKFHMRTFTFRDDIVYYGGMVQNSAKDSQWLINDINTNVISPELSYTVKYSFPADIYYTDKSDCKPEAYSVDNEKGIVEFKKVNADDIDKFQTYYIKLYPYTSVQLNDKQNTVVDFSVNGNRDDYNEKDKNYSVSKLKPNDSISISLDNIKYKVSGIDTYEKGESGYTFIYSVPEVKSADKTNIFFSTEKWSNKTITVSTSEPKKNWIEIISSLGKESPTDSILIIEKDGIENDSYSYKDLKNKKKIKIYEPDKIKLSIKKEMLGIGNVTITVNDQEKYTVDSNSDKCVFEFDYDQLESLDIKFSEKV